MASTKERKHEIETEAAVAPRKPATKRKRKRGASSAAASGSGMCDDIVRSIFARLPVRTLVASTTLSKHHRRMILCPEFSSLHCRLGPPLSRPQIAYIATAKIARGSYFVSQFHSFHVSGGAGAPTRSLTGTSYIGMKYINSCRGVLLLANSCTCVFWNPCIATSEEKKEVTIPGLTSGDCVLGFGYGTRSQTYKLLIARKCEKNSYSEYPKDLLVYSLGDTGEQWRTVLSGNQEGEGFFYKNNYSSRKAFINSLYTDGIVYLVHIPKKVVFAFDVDDETVVTINLPSGCIPDDYHEKSRLMEVLGRPCIEIGDWESITLWMLTVDHQWERMCVLDKETNDTDHCSITGAWDCGGVVLLHVNGSHCDPDRLYLLRPLTTDIFCTNLPPNLKADVTEYAFCWGYKPTLVPLGSVVGELSPEKKKGPGPIMDIIKPLEPLNEQEKRKGQEATLTIVCLMEFLAGVMRTLPENLKQVIKELCEGV